MIDEEDSSKHKSYWWDNTIFVNYGWCWATQILETSNGDGNHPMVPICLGKESEIVPILKGDSPIPEEMHPRERAVLSHIMEENYERISKSAIRATRLQRGRLVRSPRRIQRGFGHA